MRSPCTLLPHPTSQRHQLQLWTISHSHHSHPTSQRHQLQLWTISHRHHSDRKWGCKVKTSASFTLFLVKQHQTDKNHTVTSTHKLIHTHTPPNHTNTHTHTKATVKIATSDLMQCGQKFQGGGGQKMIGVKAA